MRFTRERTNGVYIKSLPMDAKTSANPQNYTTVILSKKGFRRIRSNAMIFIS